MITASLATFFLCHVKQSEEDTTETQLAERLARVEALLEQQERLGN